ncbi:MAG TPA: hypothetical protein VIN10_05455 [Bacteroidales bacterium]
MIAKGSFEDFLYIFIGLIWIGFSIYKAQQKKKAAAQGQTSTRKEKSFIENLMSEFLNEDTVDPYEVSSEKSELPKADSSKETRTRKVFSYDDYYEESNGKQDFDVFEKKPEKSALIAEEVKVYPRKHKRKPKIDLRKAVIYSEILNRKYN